MNKFLASRSKIVRTFYGYFPRTNAIQIFELKDHKLTFATFQIDWKYVDKQTNDQMEDRQLYDMMTSNGLWREA